MKQLDSASIFNRMLDTLSQNPDWKAIVSDSVVSAQLKAVAEANAETARYMEYLFNESKWDTARNLSSVSAAAGQFGYKPARKKSATGEIYISADPAIHLVGRKLFKDDFINNLFSKWGVLASTMNFNSDVKVVDSKGTPYILTSTQSLVAGSRYVKNTLMQGIKKSVIIPVEVARAVATRSKLDPYLYIPVTIENCEDAGSTGTQPFFKVFVNHGTTTEETTTEEYRVVDTVHLSSSSDMDVEVYADLYNPSLLYLKFNTSSIRGKPLNISAGSGVVSIEIQYIETTGSAGNLSTVFEPFTITDIPAYENLKLYGINFDAISGGSSEETAYQIKQNAPTFYMRSYTTATKEAYENLIRKINFGNDNYPSRVRVFPGFIEDQTSKLVRSVTHVSCLLPNLDDLASSTEASPYAAIDRTINLYLSKLKAPTDTLKFLPPAYVGIGIGVTCTATRSEVENLTTLRNGISTLLDTNYGSASANLDFGRSIYEADIISSIKAANPAILSVKTEMEAIANLSWKQAIRMTPRTTGASPLHTIRLPFSFNPVFQGANFVKGFRDYKTGAAYAARVDVIYRKAVGSSLPSYHVSLFVEEDPNRTLSAFYAIKDMDVAPIWGTDFVAADYPMDNTSTYAHLPNTYQFYYKKKLYDDDSFSRLISTESLRSETTLSTYTKTPGAIDSYLFSFTGDYAADDGTIGEGFFEFDITPLYGTLQKYAEQDVVLRAKLNQYPLPHIKCDSADTIFRGFVNDVLSTYVEILVSFRPVDLDLVPDLNDSDQNSIVLYADSADASSGTAAMTNLTADKRERLLSVECDLV